MAVVRVVNSENVCSIHYHSTLRRTKRIKYVLQPYIIITQWHSEIIGMVKDANVQVSHDTMQQDVSGIYKV